MPPATMMRVMPACSMMRATGPGELIVSLSNNEPTVRPDARSSMEPAIWNGCSARPSSQPSENPTNAFMTARAIRWPMSRSGLSG